MTHPDDEIVRDKMRKICQILTDCDVMIGTTALMTICVQGCQNDAETTKEELLAYLNMLWDKYAKTPDIY